MNRHRSLESNNHSVSELHYHLVLVVKYRRHVIDDIISEQLKSIFCHVARSYCVSVESWNHDRDHIHVLFRARPQTQLAKFISTYKSASSRIIKNNFPALRRYLWKEMFWSRSYCLITTGGVTIDIIKQYISSQGK